MWRTHLVRLYDDVVDRCQGMSVEASEKMSWDTSCLEQPLHIFDKPCEIRVDNIDAIDAAMMMDEPVVLNCASPKRPGGGVRAGALAQEEELFRRTAYHKTLLTSLYPLNDDEAIYSPRVPVVLDHDYMLISEPKTVSFIACAGLRWPPSVEGKYFRDDSDREMTRRKIQLILRTAYLKGHTNLVLGAIGCGCFRAPPNETAELFRQELQSYRFTFRTVVFAILGRVDTRLTDLFKKIIEATHAH